MAFHPCAIDDLVQKPRAVLALYGWRAQRAICSSHAVVSPLVEH